MDDTFFAEKMQDLQRQTTCKKKLSNYCNCIKIYLMNNVWNVKHILKMHSISETRKSLHVLTFLRNTQLRRWIRILCRDIFLNNERLFRHMRRTGERVWPCSRNFQGEIFFQPEQLYSGLVWETLSWRFMECTTYTLLILICSKPKRLGAEYL